MKIVTNLGNYTFESILMEITGMNEYNKFVYEIAKEVTKLWFL